MPEDFSKEDVDEIKDSSLTFSSYQYVYEKVGSNGKLDDACSMSFFSFENKNAKTIEEFADIFQSEKDERKKLLMVQIGIL